MARGSWLVKIHHYTRIGYDGISQRAALRDAQRASHLPSRQAVDEGIADGGGDGAAPFPSFGNDVGNAGFHDDFFGIDDVDETDRDADDQGRPHLPGIDEFPQAQEGCRGIADGDDDRPFEGCGFIHGSLGPRRPLRFGSGSYVFIGHEAYFAAAQFF